VNTYEIIDERVAVACSFLTQDALSLCRPAKMRWRQHTITFCELGLRHPTTKGQRMIHVFDMSDGSNDYRLEFDAEALTWTLAAVSQGALHAAS